MTDGHHSLRHTDSHAAPIKLS